MMQDINFRQTVCVFWTLVLYVAVLYLSDSNTHISLVQIITLMSQSALCSSLLYLCNHAYIFQWCMYYINAVCLKHLANQKQPFQCGSH